MEDYLNKGQIVNSSIASVQLYTHTQLNEYLSKLLHNPKSRFQKWGIQQNKKQSTVSKHFQDFHYVRVMIGIYNRINEQIEEIETMSMHLFIQRKFH